MSIRKVRILFSVSIILSLFVLTVPACHAQDKTGATDRETRINKKKEAPKKRKPLYIVKMGKKPSFLGLDTTNSRSMY